MPVTVTELSPVPTTIRAPAGTVTPVLVSVEPVEVELLVPMLVIEIVTYGTPVKPAATRGSDGSTCSSTATRAGSQPSVVH